MPLEFEKDKTCIIKGIAILMMMVHHCANPDFWDTPPEILCNTAMESLVSATKLCVGIFAFMVGYGYAFSRSKDFRYSLHHIGRLLLPFWVILGVFTFPVWLYQSHGDAVDWALLAKNAFGVNSELNWFSWFVAFYIFAMGMMPWMSRLIDRKPLIWAPALILLSYGCMVALHQLYPAYTENDWTQRLFDSLLHTPCMLLGYLFASQRWFTKVHLPQNAAMPLLAIVLAAACLVARSFIGSVLGFNLAFIYAPLFILAVLVFFNCVRWCPLNTMLSTLGAASVYMWFFHSIFFARVTRTVYAPLITISDSFLLVTLWTILLTYLCSAALKFLVDKASSSLMKFIP